MKKYKHIFLMVIITMFVSSQFNKCYAQYIVAGDSVSEGIVLKSIIKTDGHQVEDLGMWDIDIDNDELVDLHIAYSGYISNNSDTRTIIYIMNENTQLAHSISYRDYFSSEIPIHDTLIEIYWNSQIGEYDSIVTIGAYVPALVDLETDCFYSGICNWIYSFTANDSINHSSSWTSDDCIVDISLTRDAAMNSWKFNSTNEGEFIGFRKLFNNDTIYGWIDHNIEYFAVNKTVLSSIKPTVETNFDIYVYPNPSFNKTFYLHNTNRELLSCTLIDLFGTSHRSFSTSDREYSINTSDLKEGLYLLKVQKERGDKNVFKLLIR